MTVSLPWLSNLLFISIRLSTVLLFTPIQAIRQLPIHVRLILIFVFSFLVIHFLPNNKSLTAHTLLLGGIAEFANGLILATSLSAAFAVFHIAGQLIDNEMGFNTLTPFNPSEHAHEPLTSHLLSMLSVLFFFGFDGHLWLFKGLTYSFIVTPPGTPALFHGFAPVVKQFSFMFAMALMIASPIILALLAVDLASAVITRTMPQINTYFLILPIKITIGLVLLAMMLKYLNPLSTKIFEQCFHTWQEILA